MGFLPLLYGGRVSEKNLGPYSVNIGSIKINLENIGKWRVIYKLGKCISNFIDRRKLYGFMGST